MQNKHAPPLPPPESPLSSAHAVRVQHQPALPSHLESPLSRANASAPLSAASLSGASLPAAAPTLVTSASYAFAPSTASASVGLTSSLTHSPTASVTRGALSPLTAANRTASRARTRR